MGANSSRCCVRSVALVVFFRMMDRLPPPRSHFARVVTIFPSPSDALPLETTADQDHAVTAAAVRKAAAEPRQNLVMRHLPGVLASEPSLRPSDVVRPVPAPPPQARIRMRTTSRTTFSEHAVELQLCLTLPFSWGGTHHVPQQTQKCWQRGRGEFASRSQPAISLRDTNSRRFSKRHGQVRPIAGSSLVRSVACWMWTSFADACSHRCSPPRSFATSAPTICATRMRACSSPQGRSYIIYSSNSGITVRRSRCPCTDISCRATAAAR